MEKRLLTETIRNLADSIGIDALGFTDSSEFSDYVIASSPRRDPKRSMPDAKTIIVAGLYMGGITLPAWADPWFGRTSRLYLSSFFLDVVKPLEPIAQYLKDAGYQAIVCDTSREGGSILPLKLAAKRAGLGWQGRHSLLISKKYGTFLALGGILTNAPLEHNTKREPDRCRNCGKCQQACPLGALNQPYVLNRSKCLSNLLQEDNLPEEAKAVMENRVGDCEICQYACPWNKKHLDHPFATHLTESFQKRREDWERIFHLPDLVHLTEEQYKEQLGPLNTDIPYSIFHRNVLLALDNAEKTGQAVLKTAAPGTEK